MANTRWLDQPARLEDAESITEIGLCRGRSAQVMRLDAPPCTEWYVTIGNLFGSQTVRVRDLEAAIKLVGDVSRLGDDETVDLRVHKAVVVDGG